MFDVRGEGGEGGKVCMCGDGEVEEKIWGVDGRERRAASGGRGK